MKIFGFFYLESYLPSKQKKLHHCSIREGITILTTRDDNGGGGSGRGGPIPTPVCLFFSIPKPVPFKNSNGAGWGGD